MDISQDWYHIAHTPDGIVVHKLPPDEAGASAERIEEIISQRSELADRIRTQLGFPDDWMPNPGWHAQLSPGRPHEKELMARATYLEEFAEGGGGDGASS